MATIRAVPCTVLVALMLVAAALPAHALTEDSLLKALNTSISTVRDHLARLGLPSSDPLWTKLGEIEKQVGEVEELLAKGDTRGAHKLALKIFAQLGSVIEEAHRRLGKHGVVDPHLRATLARARAALHAIKMLTKRVEALESKGLIDHATAQKLKERLAKAREELVKALRDVLESIRAGTKPDSKVLAQRLAEALKTLREVRDALLKLAPKEVKQGLCRALKRESSRLREMSKALESLARRVNSTVLLEATRIAEEASEAAAKVAGTASEPELLVASLRACKCIESQILLLTSKELPALRLAIKRALSTGAALLTVLKAYASKGDQYVEALKLAGRALLELKRAVVALHSGGVAAATLHAAKALEHAKELGRAVKAAPEEVEEVVLAFTKACQRLATMLTKVKNLVGFRVAPMAKAAHVKCVKMLLKHVSGVLPSELATGIPEALKNIRHNPESLNAILKGLEEAYTKASEPARSLIKLLKCELEALKLASSHQTP